MSKVFQLKIKLLGTKPLIWRTVQIKSICTFWELHVVVRNAMDWGESQPHYFKIVDPTGNEHFIRSFLDDYDENEFPLSWRISAKKYLLNNKYKVYYIYGADDEYKHRITLEKTLYRKTKVRYPFCVDGKGITDEESDNEYESLIGKQFKSMIVFSPDDVLLTEGDRALTEHKVRLFDQLYG